MSKHSLFTLSKYVHESLDDQKIKFTTYINIAVSKNIYRFSSLNKILIIVFKPKLIFYNTFFSISNIVLKRSGKYNN